MKKYIPAFLFLLLMAFSMMTYHYVSANNVLKAEKNELTASTAPAAQSGTARMGGDIELTFENAATTPGGFILENWGALALGLLGFLETIVRLTPSQKDNSILKLISTILNSIIPNKKSGGGVH